MVDHTDKMSQWALRLRTAVTLGISAFEKLLLICIALATVVAIGAELLFVIRAQQVLLSDILLLFIYLEVLAMAKLYVEQGRVPVRYPIYIAIIALSRYLILAMKELDGITLLWLSISMLVLVLATLGLRFGHYYLPYDVRPVKKAPDKLGED